jgi:hypothetical protein
MAYADPIDPVTPTDADISGQGDDKIREFKRAVRQRLASFFIDPDADPLVPKVGSVPDDVFPVNTFDGARIIVNSIPYDRLQPAPGAGTAPANSVGTVALQDGSVTEPKLGPAAVTTAKIADGTVTGPKLAANSTNTANIVDSAVVRSKLVPAMRGCTGSTHQGFYVFPAGTNLNGAGVASWFVHDINVDTNGLFGDDVLAVINPDLTGVTPAVSWIDQLVFWGAVLNPTGIQPILRLYVKNLNAGAANDVSGKIVQYQLFQAYDTAVPE